MSAAIGLERWDEQARRLGYRNQCFIGNRFISAASGKTFTCMNPATGQLLTAVSAGGKEDIDRAVKAARAAFDKGGWPRMAGAARKKVLLQLADLMDKQATELALLETLDTGRPIAESSKVDVPRSIQCIRWCAEAIDEADDETGPRGVIGAVVPWSFPLLIGSWQIGPALAAGCSMVVQPAEQAPLSMLRLAELAAEAGVPEGVLNVIPGQGETAAQALGRHLDVDAIALADPARCGSKALSIVMADAPDLDAAVEAAAWGRFFNRGEVCSASSRLIVEESVKDVVLEKIQKIAQALQPGDALDPATSMGAIIDETQMNRVLGHIEAARKEGAKLACGGKRVRTESGGYYIEPTVFENVKTSKTIAQKEIFGPVLSMITFKDQAEAVKIGNDMVDGLAAALWTRDARKTQRISLALRAGVAWVNCRDNG